MKPRIGIIRLEVANPENPIKKEYNGKTYTLYGKAKANRDCCSRVGQLFKSFLHLLSYSSFFWNSNGSKTLPYMVFTKFSEFHEPNKATKVFLLEFPNKQPNPPIANENPKVRENLES